jgi:hypothetical protein
VGAAEVKVLVLRLLALQILVAVVAVPKTIMVLLEALEL